jgi:3-oxoacyl-[acyl-carrier-protein] synthase-1
LVPSGGAATVILESYESAIRRGATILGEVAGYGFSSNGEHISLPNVDGPVSAMQLALKESRMGTSAIDYINAHATSTPAGDENEAKAIDQIFGKSRPLVSSTKSMTGHEMWMGGASEIIYSILMMNHNFVAPNINFDNPDETTARLNIVSHTIQCEIISFKLFWIWWN